MHPFFPRVKHLGEVRGINQHYDEPLLNFFEKLQIRDSAILCGIQQLPTAIPPCLLRQETQVPPENRSGSYEGKFFSLPAGPHQSGGASGKNDAGQTANRCAVHGLHAEKSRFSLGIAMSLVPALRLRRTRRTIETPIPRPADV